MKTFHILPHRVCESTCYVNGLEDILTWKGGDYVDFLLSLLEGWRFYLSPLQTSRSTCMVYWGANTKYLIKDLSNIIRFKETVIEGKTFKNTFHN